MKPTSVYKIVGVANCLCDYVQINVLYNIYDDNTRVYTTIYSGLYDNILGFIRQYTRVYTDICLSVRSAIVYSLRL